MGHRCNVYRMFFLLCFIISLCHFAIYLHVYEPIQKSISLLFFSLISVFCIGHTLQEFIASDSILKLFFNGLIVMIFFSVLYGLLAFHKEFRSKFPALFPTANYLHLFFILLYKQYKRIKS